MRNLKRLNPLIYWTLQLTWDALNTIFCVILPKLIKITLLICGGFLLLAMFTKVPSYQDDLEEAQRKRKEWDDNGGPFVYGTQGKLYDDDDLLNGRIRR